MRDYGYVRVGAIVNKLALANPLENAKELIKNIKSVLWTRCGTVPRCRNPC